MQRAVDDVEGRSARPVVEERVVVEGHDERAAAGEMLRGGAGGAGGVDPAIECHDQDGGDQRVGECADAQHGHVRSIVAVDG